MSTDESKPVPTLPSEPASTFGANVRIAPDIQVLATNSSQSDKCCRYWLDLPEDDNLRPRQ